MRIIAGPTLAAMKEAALRRIDEEAEVARTRFVTPGSGQALEYQATEAEARALIALQDANGNWTARPWPWLEAERAAQGGGPTLRQIADVVVAQADAWVAVGAAIKELRRGAKLAVESATTVAAVRAASTVQWPSP